MVDNPFGIRRQRLREELERRGLAGAFIADPNNLFYLTGIMPHPSFPSILLLNLREAAAVIPQLGVVPPSQVPADDPLHLVTYANLAMADLRRHVDETNERDSAAREAFLRLGLAGKRLGVEGDLFLHRLARAFEIPSDHLSDIGPLLYAARVIKDDWEVSQLEYAVHLNDIGFGAAQAHLRAGVTDLQVFSKVWLAMAEELGGPFVLRGEFSGGPDISGRGGSAPVGRLMHAGDILIADMYPVINGYVADTTRNFVIGQPASWQSDLHQILEEALKRGEESIRPGLPASEMDKIVRGHVEASAPAGAVMFHHCGHGLGIGVGKAGHYPPYIVPHSRDILQPGMVFTLEPGLYITGTGGMRLEENFLVTETGGRPLGTFPKKLIVCGSS